MSAIDTESPAVLSLLSGDGRGDKVLVVKITQGDAFVLTAYLTDRVKRGWQAMARDRVKAWYGAEGDYLEVLFDQRPGYFRETTNDQVMEKVDAEGNVLGFSVLKASGIG